MSAFRQACAVRGLIPLEDFLRRAAARDVMQHALRVSYCDDERVVVSLVCLDAREQVETLHFSVAGNRLSLCDANGTVE